MTTINISEMARRVRELADHFEGIAADAAKDFTPEEFETADFTKELVTTAMAVIRLVETGRLAAH